MYHGSKVDSDRDPSTHYCVSHEPVIHPPIQHRKRARFLGKVQPVSKGVDEYSVTDATLIKNIKYSDAIVKGTLCEYVVIPTPKANPPSVASAISKVTAKV